MIDILNIAISLICVLFRMREQRDELNRQGADWIRMLKYKKRYSRCKDKKVYMCAIRNFENRAVELNLSVVISRYTAISLILMVISYAGLFWGSNYIKAWMSAVLVIVVFICTSGLIKLLAKKLDLAQEKIHYDDILFVVSSVLSLALIVRKWDLGLFAVGVSLSRYIWIDVFQKRNPLLTDIRNAFVNESVALVTSLEMVFVYLLLHGFYVLLASKTYMPWFVMLCAYITSFSSVMALGGGLKSVTRVTKQVADETVKEERKQSKDSKCGNNKDCRGKNEERM